MQVGGMDVLRDEGIAYAEALEAAGNEVTLISYQGLPHFFNGFPMLPRGKEYFDRVCDFVKKYSGPVKESK
jgi:acetyl esterase/lipase